MEDMYDVPSDKEIEEAIEMLECTLRALRAMQKLNNEGRMKAMTILFEMSHTKKYMKKYTRNTGGA